MPTINMRSSANLIKGQGVGSCYEEQVRLVTEGLNGFTIYDNSNKKCDIIHYHTVNLNYYVERLFTRRRNTAVGYVHFLPDTLEDSLDLPWPFKKLFYKYLLSFYNSMDFLVTVNPSVIKKLEDYKITRPKIVYIPNYVSDKDFYPQSPEIIRLNKELFDLPTDRKIILGAGQLQRRKGIIDFVEVARQLPEYQFVWAGGFSFGKISDGYEQIKAIMQEPPENMRFLGIVDRDKMVDLYNLCDIMFLPSFDELFPMTILEALCCKKAILLRDISIYEDILFDCYMKEKTPAGFARVIREALNDAAVLNHWEEKAWECHNYYTPETILAEWESLYNEAYVKLKQSEWGNASLWATLLKKI